MNDCGEIGEMIPDYVNNNTNKEQSSIIIRHISVCPACRRDAAMWITVKRDAIRRSVDPPAEITLAMFDKISEKESEINTVARAFDTIRYALDAVRGTFKLTRILLGG